jgi:hypothetical protein
MNSFTFIIKEVPSSHVAFIEMVLKDNGITFDVVSRYFEKSAPIMARPTEGPLSKPSSAHLSNRLSPRVMIQPARLTYTHPEIKNSNIC